MLGKMFKDLLLGKDSKPLTVSFFLQQDDCSRLLGEFGEKQLPRCSKLAIVWKNGDGEAYVQTSDSLEAEEAIGMLIKAAHRIGGDGNKTANIFKS